MSSSHKGNILVQRIYRSLLKVAGNFDKKPTAKVLLHASPSSSKGSSTDFSSVLYNSRIKKVLQGRDLYLPAADDGTSSGESFACLVKDSFRDPSNTREEIDQRIDAAFIALRKLNSVWNSYKEIEKQRKDTFANSTAGLTQWPALQLSPAWLKENGSPDGFPPVEYADKIEPGVLLIAHPLIDGPLGRSVILLLDHEDLNASAQDDVDDKKDVAEEDEEEDEEEEEEDHESGGSYGLTINSSFQHKLNTTVLNLPEDIEPHFGELKAAFGGVVQRMQFVHSLAQSRGTEIPHCDSVQLYAGGSLEKILSFAQKHPQQVPDSVAVYVGCCTWYTGQLEREMQAGFWIPVRSNPDKIIALMRGGVPLQQRSLGEISSPQAAPTASGTNATDGDKPIPPQQQRTPTPHEIWQRLLLGLGPSYVPLAMVPSSVSLSDVESCTHDALC